MVQKRISSEGRDHTFNVDIPFTGEKIRELIRDRTNIPEETQFLFDYPEMPSSSWLEITFLTRILPNISCS